MNGADLTEIIVFSLYTNEEFESKFIKMNVIGFVKLFLEKYDFEEFAETHQITEQEYKKYFKNNVKYHYPHLNKIYKKLYKLAKEDL